MEAIDVIRGFEALVDKYTAGTFWSRAHQDYLGLDHEPLLVVPLWVAKAILPMTNPNRKWLPSGYPVLFQALEPGGKELPLWYGGARVEIGADHFIGIQVPLVETLEEFSNVRHESSPGPPLSRYITLSLDPPYENFKVTYGEAIAI